MENHHELSLHGQEDHGRGSETRRKFARLAGAFMEQIFELESGEDVISDESAPPDFTETGSSDDLPPESTHALIR